MKHTLSVLVEDESGALVESQAFCKEGFNIDSLAVGLQNPKDIKANDGS